MRSSPSLLVLLERLQVSDLGISLCVGILFWIAVVDAIDLGGLENHFRADFSGAQSGGGISGKIRIARAATEDNHAAFLEMADSPAANEWLGDLRHGYGRLHPCGDAEFLQSVLQGERVDHR